MLCKPLLSGALWNLGHSNFVDDDFNYDLTLEGWRAQFEAMENIGFRYLMIFTGISTALHRPGKAAPDLIELIASECDRRNMKLILAIGGIPNWREDGTGALAKESIEMLHKRYGYHSSFSGWYLDFEVGLPWNEDAYILIRSLYRSVVEICHRITPDLPIVASPLFAPATIPAIMGYGSHTPEMYYEFWSELLKYAQVDILLLQDNGGQHFSFFTTCDTEPFIAAYAAACRENSCRFWGNVETGEIKFSSAAAFVDKFGLDGNVNSPECRPMWHPVPLERLEKKLRVMCKYSEMNLSWGYREFYRPDKDAAAANAYQKYAEYRKQILTVR